MKGLPRRLQVSTVRGTNREQPAPYLRYWDVLSASRRAAAPPFVFAAAVQYVADPGWMTETSPTHCCPSRENSRSPRAPAGGRGPNALGWSMASPGSLVCVCVCGYNKEHKKHSNRNYNEAKATNQKRNDQQPHDHQSVQKARGTKSRHCHITITNIHKQTQDETLIPIADICGGAAPAMPNAERDMVLNAFW
jgi:hypothetical protein